MSLTFAQFLHDYPMPDYRKDRSTVDYIAKAAGAPKWNCGTNWACEPATLVKTRADLDTYLRFFDAYHRDLLWAHYQAAKVRHAFPSPEQAENLMERAADGDESAINTLARAGIRA